MRSKFLTEPGVAQYGPRKVAFIEGELTIACGSMVLIMFWAMCVKVTKPSIVSLGSLLYIFCAGFHILGIYGSFHSSYVRMVPLHCGLDCVHPVCMPVWVYRDTNPVMKSMNVCQSAG